jgi:lactoylglutathione lyase
MKLPRREDFPGGRLTLAFVGYGPEDSHTVAERTHNWDQAEPYQLGSAFGRLALGVNDIHAVCGEVEKQGAKIPRKPAPMKHGTTHIAFIEDPNGYRIEPIGIDTRHSAAVPAIGPAPFSLTRIEGAFLSPLTRIGMIELSQTRGFSTRAHEVTD